MVRSGNFVYCLDGRHPLNSAAAANDRGIETSVHDLQGATRSLRLGIVPALRDPSLNRIRVAATIWRTGSDAVTPKKTHSAEGALNTGPTRVISGGLAPPITQNGSTALSLTSCRLNPVFIPQGGRRPCGIHPLPITQRQSSAPLDRLNAFTRRRQCPGIASQCRSDRDIS
jgi:hypothetical protein